MNEYAELLNKKIEEKKLLEEEILLLSKLIKLNTKSNNSFENSDTKEKEDKKTFYDSEEIKKMSVLEIQSIVNNNLCDIIYRKATDNSIRRFETVSFNTEAKREYFKNNDLTKAKQPNRKDKDKIFIIEDDIYTNKFKKLIKDNIVSLNIL